MKGAFAWQLCSCTECGLGTEEDLAEAFGRHVRSVQRYVADFAGEGMQGLMPERRGPKGRWKLTVALRGKILLIVLREGIWKLEAIQQRLLEAWHEAVSVPSIQQVLEENGLGEPTARGIGDAVIQGELFAFEPEPQLVLPLAGHAAQPGTKSAPAACGKRKAERKRQRCGRPDRSRRHWGGDGDETPIRQRNESIWIGWNKVLTMRMLAGCCLRRCWRDMILFRR